MKREKRYMNVKFTELRLSDEEPGIFEGYATTFGNTYPIYYGVRERVARGAFEKTLNENPNFAIIADHRIAEHIGYAIGAHEDNKGLFLRGELVINDSAKAREKYALMQLASRLPHAQMGLSMGFITIKDKIIKKVGEPDTRILLEVSLPEVSPTAFPANPEAGVTQVRSIEDIVESIMYLPMDQRALAVDEIANRMKQAAPPGFEPNSNIHSILKALETANRQLTR